MRAGDPIFQLNDLVYINYRTGDFYQPILFTGLDMLGSTVVYPRWNNVGVLSRIFVYGWGRGALAMAKPKKKCTVNTRGKLEGLGGGKELSPLPSGWNPAHVYEISHMTV